jgi:plasmid stabilization system protein ParE
VATSEPQWLDEAIADAEQAREWYAARSPLAARGFLLELQAALGAVAEAPERWAVDRRGYRRYVFPHRYPYKLVYRPGPPIVIVAIAHDKRRPGYWHRR